jgi:hypothetical protein
VWRFCIALIDACRASALSLSQWLCPLPPFDFLAAVRFNGLPPAQSESALAELLLASRSTGDIFRDRFRIRQ